MGFMDMETRHPIRVSEEERKGYVIEEGINDLKADRKIKRDSSFPERRGAVPFY